MAPNDGPVRDNGVALLALGSSVQSVLGLDLLDADGGGIRSLSELLILHEIMHRIKHDLGLSRAPPPCEYFGLIGGTSTGGLIALLLGRLQMSTDEALQTYNSLVREIFSKDNRKWAHQDGSFKATTLERKIQDIVSEKGLGELMLSPLEQENTGKAFVCAVAASDLMPRLFRTYPVRENPSVNCQIWQAARATSAAPTFFKRISIPEEGRPTEDFIDAAVGYNNPANLVLEEAKNIFGTKRRIRCIVSIGTGHPGTVGLARPDAFQKILPTDLIRVLKRTATECQQTAMNLSKRFRDFEDFYFRFNVEHGAEGISLEEWNRMGDLQGFTKTYMSEVSVTKAIDKVVEKLRQPASSEQTLGSTLGEQNRSNVKIRPRPVPTPIFTGRAKILERLNDFFSSRSPGSPPRRECLLHGMGGAGKTQIALKFAREFMDRFQRVFWIHASDRLTVEQSYKAIAADHGLADKSEGDLVRRVLQWLSRSEQEWLLLFDNYGSVGVTEHLLPHGDHGNILYTGRNPELGLIVQESILVTEIENDDAISLLLRAAKKECTDKSLREQAKPIVDSLGYLPLAIDIAGASIYMGQYRLDTYVQAFQLPGDTMMNDSTFKGSSKYNQAVYTAWDISYEAIQAIAQGRTDVRKTEAAKSAVQIIGLFAYFHRENIMEEIFKRAAENQKHLRARRSLKKCDNLLRLLTLDQAGIWDPYLFRTGISMLISFSLIKQDQGGRYFSMHTLVHSWAQDRMHQSVKRYQKAAATAVLSSSITRRFLSEDYAIRRELLPHIRACASWIKSETISDTERARDVRNFARVYNESGHWKEAEELKIQVIKTRIQILGTEHPDTLDSQVSLASTHTRLDRYKEAEELLVQVTETQKRILGEEHPDTLASQENLAATFKSQGRFTEAISLMSQCAETSLRRLGKEHPDTQDRITYLKRWLEEQQGSAT